jgi:hypothetical protein
MRTSSSRGTCKGLGGVRICSHGQGSSRYSNPKPVRRRRFATLPAGGVPPPHSVRQRPVALRVPNPLEHVIAASAKLGVALLPLMASTRRRLRIARETRDSALKLSFYRVEEPT